MDDVLHDGMMDCVHGLDCPSSRRNRRPVTPPCIASTGPIISGRRFGSAMRRVAMATAVAFCMPAAMAQVRFPSDAGIIDVTSPPYNAKGDGVADDTAAINRALATHNRRAASAEHMPWTIYLPPGIYRVTDTLGAQSASVKGEYVNGVRITGGGAALTTIRIDDANPRFADPGDPRPVLRTGGSPTDMVIRGRKSTGQPNSAYSNYIEHLSVDIGAKNPGAVGIRFDVANVGALSDVRIRSSDAAGAGRYGLQFVGTSGPGFVRDVAIAGFDYGVHLDRTPVNNINFEALDLSGQRRAGIYNGGKVIGLLSLRSHNAVPALLLGNEFATAFLIDARLSAPRDTTGPAIAGRGFLYARDVETTGYARGIAGTLARATAPPDGQRIGEWSSHAAPGLDAGATPVRLPVHTARVFASTDMDDWESVTKHGAIADDGRDDTAAIQRAIDAGKPIVYFPRGTYAINGTLELRGAVRRLDLLFSRISAQPGARIRIGRTDAAAIAIVNGVIDPDIEHDSETALAIANIGGPSTLRTTRSATGDVFVENAGPHAQIVIQGKQRAWIRSVNRESKALINDGATVWIFGDNIERMSHRSGGSRKVNAILTRSGGMTEYLAGCLDALTIAHEPDDGALFVVEDGRLSATYAGLVRLRRSPLPTWGRWPHHLGVRRGNGLTVIPDTAAAWFTGSAAALQRRFFAPPVTVTAQAPEDSVVPSASQPLTRTPAGATSASP
ncbi:glycosyl hydrolase family 28-related protein [Sinimarinibacterium flocculans]|uniref:glycosyl hydrolase family 28-related protein n=1 Tax=Sinimarinibacterium flocculans TaxID=985250 RepID=UPI0035119583